LQPLAADATLLAFGDSLTRGKGVTEAASYPTVLSKLISRTVVNAGVSGETTRRGVARFADVLKAASPELVILMHGGNDILRDMDRSETKAHLSTMIEHAHAAGVQVLLLGLPEKRLFSSSAAIYGELAEQYSIVFEPSIVSSLLRQPKMKSDAVHFNAHGYAALAERIHEMLTENGAL
jgi:lysophospholipase L1-like esterase